MKIIGKKSALRTPEFHRKKEFQRKVRLYLVGVLFILLIITPIVIVRSARLQIARIEVEGNNATKPELIQEIVTKNLAGSYGWIIPKSSSVFYPEKKIVSELVSSIPRISTAAVSLKDSHTISVSLEERTPAALYCEDVSNSSSPSGCYFMDKEGFIFSEAASFSGEVFPVFTSNPVMKKPVGQIFLSNDKFQTLMKFISDAERFHLNPKFVTKNMAEYEMLLTSGTWIFWKEEQNEDQLISNLDSFLYAPKTNGSEELNRLVYIDLRFGNKVFYKFRDETNE